LGNQFLAIPDTQKDIVEELNNPVKCGSILAVRIDF
jgi:hypothetical protein